MDLIAIGIGGFLGAMIRYKMGLWIPVKQGFPAGTLTINLLGCLFLSWFFTITLKRWKVNPNLRLGIGTGFTGAFTTFSTFSVDTLNLLNHHQFLLAIVYVLSSVIGGIGLAIAGAKAAIWLPVRKNQSEEGT